MYPSEITALHPSIIPLLTCCIPVVYHVSPPVQEAHWRSHVQVPEESMPFPGTVAARRVPSWSPGHGVSAPAAEQGHLHWALDPLNRAARSLSGPVPTFPCMALHTHSHTHIHTEPHTNTNTIKPTYTHMWSNTCIFNSCTHTHNCTHIMKLTNTPTYTQTHQHIHLQSYTTTAIHIYLTYSYITHTISHTSQ